MVKDKKAEELESKGLYRRAAARWAEVMSLSNNERDRDFIAAHRKECLDKIRRTPARSEDFGDLHKAARETQHRMGIAQPNGEAFRLKGKAI
ncbi:PerC family transcriptional regulator [Salmonella enterica subsp. enterica serovar Thompson]|uniref:PerC family transcriptional regulator n=3 Tax=Salmonella enterica I TaxID=59201 RepID=A0A733UZZ9_SALET|nr:PerC family transcriptional regulator [Salmonella enterica]EAA0939514.1 PerC family transcriptional regulator [Salmonella enterica subsp. enterica serovar Braenderup]EAA6003059.1 PerC family transcriptional regulator [Salmonella enterica subsp. enterica serovar Oranienburg]EBG9264983.1 PerC family transcriptional regulator [Salmonella enterica subsp. enterica serovar Havana]EBK1726166.1 PerC family transcriptional regulator [Salmonella enterica subsp. enterica serovar Virchow]EBV8515848.1 P